MACVSRVFIYVAKLNRCFITYFLIGISTKVSSQKIDGLIELALLTIILVRFLRLSVCPYIAPLVRLHSNLNCASNGIKKIL